MGLIDRLLGNEYRLEAEGKYPNEALEELEKLLPYRIDSDYYKRFDMGYKEIYSKGYCIAFAVFTLNE